MKVHTVSKYKEINILQQNKDGYIHATAMCKAFGKKIGQYNLTKSVKAFLEALSTDVGIPTSKLMKVIKGGSGSKYVQGTWVHPLVAIHLAQWLSPEFSVHVSKMVFDWQSHKTEIAARERPVPQIALKPETLSAIQIADLQFTIHIAVENSWPGGGVVRTLAEYCQALAAEFKVFSYTEILSADIQKAIGFVNAYAGVKPYENRDITLRLFVGQGDLTDCQKFEKNLAMVAINAMNLVRDRPLKNSFR
ncbi:MAG: KilA-N domain-containing protein [Rhizobiales bacterium]|nr:KilA-N domain-containing protein [Hyphomicrobiales bacterium]NRB15059.1 KilA-N domain-containing protein [Hyphomicrobiales bacterium]